MWRMRLNTLPGRKMYFPIVFSQYDSFSVNKIVHGETGEQDTQWKQPSQNDVNMTSKLSCVVIASKK